jgi:general secretion pathway protein A
MDYYEIFGLKREPFSNSPDPELFYATPKYLEVLHKLEIAIRLKRGLNLVLGDVGTGKTTMSRVLLRTLDQEREKFLVRLILDPGFPSDEEMLSYLLSLLGGGQGLSGSRTLLMDSLQRLLLRLTTEEGKVVAIFIDEGQKLSPSGLEILRELLNFESNQ